LAIVSSQIRIIVLNYNGAALLPQCLPSIVTAAQRAQLKTETTILDNLSTDAGLDYVASAFPEVTVVRAAQNKVLCSYNDYLRQIEEPVVILLNNDIRVDPGFVNPLVRKFAEDSRTFLVAPRVMSFDGTRVEAGRSKAGIRFGIFWCKARYPGYETEAFDPSSTCSSGFGAFSKKGFLELGGYDERYLPGIMEDVDLCYRAQKRGYHLYYEPQSVIFHIGQASFKKAFGEAKMSEVAHRNNFLFMWKNFSGFQFYFSHIFFLPLRLLWAALKGNRAFVRGFWNALQLERKK